MSQPNIVDITGQLPHNGNYPLRPIANIKLIGIHYDGVDSLPGLDPIPFLQQEAQEHIDRDWGGGYHGAGLMYHYCIDDQIYRTAPEVALLWAAMNANPLGLFIKMRAGPNTPPNQTKLDLLIHLLYWLCNERPDFPASASDVWGHGELTQYGNSTQCPGDVLRNFCQSYRVGAIGGQPVGSPHAADDSEPYPLTKGAANTIVTDASVIRDYLNAIPPNIQGAIGLADSIKRQFGAL